MASENIKNRLLMQVEKLPFVANCINLTNHRSKNQKVIMHHTQGVWGLGVFFVYGGLRLRNGAVNDQRQGIITAMVSCLFDFQKGACVVRA